MGVAGVLLVLASAAAAGQEIRPVPRDDRKHLALDDFTMETAPE